MDKLIEKIDSYNIFNYFVPGAMVFEFLRLFVSAPRVSDILARILAYYLTGLVVSRIGSMVLEPVFKSVKLVKHSDYDTYVRACESDKKIELFVEIANMYRTIYVGSLICLLVTFATTASSVFSGRLFEVRVILLTLVLLFFFSYRKQSNYVNKRVALRA